MLAYEISRMRKDDELDINHAEAQLVLKR